MRFTSSLCLLLAGITIHIQISHAQWTSLSAAGGDRGPLCVLGNTLFMGGLSGTLWRTTNQGTTWLATPGLSGTSSTFALALDGTTIYASRGTERIIKSTDNGVTWNQVNTGLPPPGSYNAALFATGGRVFVGNASQGVYVTTDGGVTWTQANNGLTNLQTRALGGRGDTVFVGTNSGNVFRSTNGGQLWIDVTPSFSNLNTSIYFISIIDSSVFVGGIAFGTMGLVRSDDWGLTWNQDNQGIPTNTSLLQAGGIVKVDTFLFAGMYSGGIFKRSKSDATWSLVSSPQMLVQSPPVYPSTYHLSVLGIIAQGTTLFVQTSPVGLFRSTDRGTSWKQVTNNAGGGFDRRGLVKNGETLYMGGDNGVFISTDNGGFWNTYHGNVFDAARLSSFAFVDTLVFTGQMNLGYGMLRSTDGGRFWTRINTGLTGSARNINKLATVGSTIFAGTAAGIYVSSDRGESWSATAFPNQYVSELHAHGSTLFAFSQYLLSRSSDMGQTWTTITNGIDPWDWVDVTSYGSRLILCGGGIFTSTNDGVSWSNITGNLAPVQFYAIAIAGDTIYTATAFNCYYSINLGQSWTLIPNTGLPLTPSFRHLLVHGGYIYAGMGESGNLGGAWRRPVPGTTSVERIDANVPGAIALMQNYPNPFNPSTNLEFQMPNSGMVSLKIYDLLGREVATLVNEEMRYGSYSVTWDASDMPSGVYFSRLSVGGASIAKRMILMK